MPPSRRQFLKSSAAVATGAGLAGCIFTVDTVDSLPRPFLGASSDSDVPVIQAFEDLQCPACRDFSTGPFQQVKSEYLDTNEARFEWYDFPLPVNPQLSRPAHYAARSVQDNDSIEAFWAVEEVLFERQDELGSIEDIARVCAQNSSVDANTVLEDARRGVYSPVVQADVDEGNSLEVSVTPTVFVDGVQVDPTFDAIQQAVESNRN